MSEYLPSHELLRENLTGSVLEKTKRRLKRKPAPKVKKKPKTADGPHKCTECDKIFKAKKLLNDHMLCHSEDRPYKCKQCPYTGKSPKYLYNHVRKVHVCVKKFICDQCPMGFITPSRLVIHKRVHTGEKPYKCDVCDKSFSASYCLSIHKYVHTSTDMNVNKTISEATGVSMTTIKHVLSQSRSKNTEEVIKSPSKRRRRNSKIEVDDFTEDEKPYKCTYCDYACRDTSTLRKHKQRHLDIEYYHKCKLCDKEYKDKGALKFHIAETHLKVDIRKFECDICNTKFRLKATLSNHIQNVHDKTTRVQCEICKVYASNKMNLVSHMRIHVAAKPFRCHEPGCGSGFKDGSSLRKHAKSHIEKHIDYQTCEYCHISFTTKQDLKVHIRLRHTLIANKYICDYCSFQTTLKTCLVGHIKHKHMKENYSCRICKKVYKLKHYYVKHNYKHHGVGVKENNSSSNDVQINYEPTSKSEGLCVKILKYESINDENREKDASNLISNTLNRPNDSDTINDIVLRKIKEEPQNVENDIVNEEVCENSSRIVNNEDVNKELDSNSENNSFNELENTVSKQGTNERDKSISGESCNEIENISSQDPHETTNNVSNNDLTEGVNNVSGRDLTEEETHISENFNGNKSNIADQDSYETEDVSIQNKDDSKQKDACEDNVISLKTGTDKNISKKKKRISKRKQKEVVEIEDNFADFMKKLGVDINNMEEARNKDEGKNKDLAEIIMDSQGKRIDDISKDVFDQYFIDSYKKTASTPKVDARKDQTEEAIVQESVKKFLSQRKQKIIIRKTKSLKRICVSNRDKIDEKIEGLNRSSKVNVTLNIREVKETEDKINTNRKNVIDKKDKVHKRKESLNSNKKKIKSIKLVRIATDNIKKEIEDDNDTIDGIYEHIGKSGTRYKINFERDDSVTRDEINQDVNETINKINEGIDEDNTRDEVNDDKEGINYTSGKNYENKDEVKNSGKGQTDPPAIKNKRKDRPSKRKKTNKVKNENTLDTSTLRRSKRATRINYKALIETGELSEEEKPTIKKPSDNKEKPSESTEKSSESAEKPSESTEKPSDNTEKPSDNTEKQDGKETLSRKITKGMHQCYVCLKIFDSKAKLMDHCKDHFAMCTETTLKKCPLCDFVTNLCLNTHLQRKHNIKLKYSYSRIYQKRENNVLKFFYKVQHPKFDRIELIPSIRYLNKAASMWIDKKNREKRAKIVAKNRLVKKDNEWVIETEKLDIKNHLVIEADGDKNGEYIEKMKEVYKEVKKKGEKMVFPCKNCDKVCLTLSALKLHHRKHDTNAKPFKQKVYKYKQNLKNKNIQNIDKIVPVNTGNRQAKPQPIKNNHKCDPELKKFYENNIKGGDIEFWQFLKIFNKLGREKVEDFDQLEKRIDFGVHRTLDDIVDNANENNKNTSSEINEATNSKINKDANSKINKDSRKIIRKRIENTKQKGNAFVKVLKLTKRQHLKRLKIKQRLRDQIAAKVICKMR